MIALAPIFSNAGKHTYSQSMPMSNAKKIMAIFILFACHEDVGIRMPNEMTQSREADIAPCS